MSKIFGLVNIDCLWIAVPIFVQIFIDQNPVNSFFKKAFFYVCKGKVSTKLIRVEGLCPATQKSRNYIQWKKIEMKFL